MDKPNEWWISDNGEDPCNAYCDFDEIRHFPRITHVIEYNAYAAVVRERDKLCAEVERYGWEHNQQVEFELKRTAEIAQLSAEVERLKELLFEESSALSVANNGWHNAERELEAANRDQAYGVEKCADMVKLINELRFKLSRAVAQLKRECCCPGENSWTPPYAPIKCDACELLAEIESDGDIK